PTVSVVALDNFNNVATTDNSDVVTVHLQSNVAGANLTGATSVQLVHGMAAFPTLQLNKAGSGFTLAASAPLLRAVVSNPFDVAAVARFNVTTTQTMPLAAGNGVMVLVQAVDAKGQTVLNYAGTVHFTSSDPQADLPLDTQLSMGQGSFTVKLKT